MKTSTHHHHRRQFMKEVGAAAAGVFLHQALPATESFAAETEAGGVPRRTLGRTGETLSIMGIGGHTLALASSEKESIRLVHEAIDNGINFMDNAWDYHDGHGIVA